MFKVVLTTVALVVGLVGWGVIELIPGASAGHVPTGGQDFLYEFCPDDLRDRSERFVDRMDCDEFAETLGYVMGVVRPVPPCQLPDCSPFVEDHLTCGLPNGIGSLQCLGVNLD